MERIPGPDFPTAGFICGRAGIRQAYRTGRGSVIMRAQAEIEVRKGDRESIVVTEIPYQVNKARLIEKIAELARDKRIEGIADIRDESDRQGMRIVIDVAQGRAQRRSPEQPLQAHPAAGHLRHHHAGHRRPAPAGPEPAGGLRATSSTSGARWCAGAPPSSCARRRRAPTSSKGFVIALDHLDEVIALIRGARDAGGGRGRPHRAVRAHARSRPRTILEMQLQRLTGLERQKIVDELAGDPHPHRRPQGHPGPARARGPHRGRGAGARSARSTATRAAPRSSTPWTSSRPRT